MSAAATSTVSKYPVQPVWVTSDGKWIVTVVRLSHVARPYRSTDPRHGDGEYLLAKARNVFAYASTVDELVAKTGIDLRDLREQATS